MAKQATGHVRWFNGSAVARIRVASNLRESFAMSNCRTEEEAIERAQLLADVARRMRLAGVDLERARKAVEMVATASPRLLRNALTVAGELVGGELCPASAPSAPTFRQIGEQWTSGALARQYPDQIRVKRSAHTDVSRLGLYVYPLLQDLPIDGITLDHCEDVMRKLPPKLTPATRQRVGALMARVLTMAVYPLRLIERSPIPRGFLPGVGKQKALAYLFPDEDRRLMACQTVPLEYRLLWGFLFARGHARGRGAGADVGRPRPRSRRSAP